MEFNREVYTNSSHPTMNSGKDKSDNSIDLVRQMTATVRRRPIFDSIRACIAGGLSSTIHLFHVYLQKKSSPMCTNYGHINTQKTWKGWLPKCEDCGATIKDPSELRSSRVRQLADASLGSK